MNVLASSPPTDWYESLRIVASRPYTRPYRWCGSATKYGRPAVPVRDLWVSCSSARPGRTILHMTKRILAAFLWFYTGWYAGAMLAEILSISPVLGPIIGAAAAGLIVGDPRGMIWKRQAIRPTSPSVASSAPEGLPKPA